MPEHPKQILSSISPVRHILIQAKYHSILNQRQIQSVEELRAHLHAIITILIFNDSLVIGFFQKL